MSFRERFLALNTLALLSLILTGCDSGNESSDVAKPPRLPGFEIDKKKLIEGIGDLAASPVNSILKNLRDRANEIITHAGAEADLFRENTARSADLLLQSANIVLKDNLNTSFDRLDVESQKYLVAIKQTIDSIDNATGRILELEDMMALDIQNWINQIPFKKDLYLIRRIEGFSQSYQEHGTYDFGVIGNAFGPGYIAEITIADHKVQLFDIRLDRAHETKFQIPVDSINARFRDNNVVRIPIKIDSFKSRGKKPVFTYNGMIWLLPKYPIAYTLKVDEQEVTWSDPKDSPEGQARIPPTGKEGAWRTGEVSAHVPIGTQLIKGTEQIRAISQRGNAAAEEWGYWDKAGFRYSNGDRTVTIGYHHQIHDQWRQIFIQVKYREQGVGTKETQYKFNGDLDGRLQYGTFFVNLKPPPITQSYRLSVHYFNGKRVELRPNSSSAPGLKVELEQRSGFARMTFEIKNQTR